MLYLCLMSKPQRFFFHIGYNGSAYSGWQKHAGVFTVQQSIENALSKLFKTTVEVIGCGRTDAQVHAAQFFFHADLVHQQDFDLKFRLNKVLPADIAVFDIIAMDGLPHARFDAVQRKYDYLIHTHKDPFLTGLSSLYLGDELDIKKINQAASLLPLYNDYAAFCKSPAKNEHTICHVSAAEITANANNDRFRFEISSNRFLSRMIRIIMGKLLKVGVGQLSVDEFESYLITKKTPAKLEPAHPQGLFLSKVTYPYMDLQAKSNFLPNW